MSDRRPRIPAGSPVVAARSMAGFTLVEVLVALGLVASVGTVASGAAAAMLEFAHEVLHRLRAVPIEDM